MAHLLRKCNICDFHKGKSKGNAKPRRGTALMDHLAAATLDVMADDVYGRGSNSIKPLRIARIAACVRS